MLEHLVRCRGMAHRAFTQRARFSLELKEFESVIRLATGCYGMLGIMTSATIDPSMAM